MRWLRDKRTWVTRLALFALALQIVVSFGHVHVAAGKAEATLATAASDATPVHKQKHQEQDCAICAAAHLAGNGVLPSPVALALPTAEKVVWHQTIAHQTSGQRVAHFHARGPPLI